jgi:hypothetical protein
MNARRSVGTILIGLCANFAPLAVGAGGASAQAIYRCADNSYSQQPCDGGRPVRVDDPRTPQQQKDSVLAARREAAMADAMEKSRLQRQAQAERAVAAQQAAAAATGKPKPQPSAKPAQQPKVFVASVPGAKKKGKEKADETVAKRRG